MEIFAHRPQMLDAIESSTKGNNNFVTKVISTENVEGKSTSLKKGGRTKKKDPSFFIFLVNTLGDYFKS